MENNPSLSFWENKNVLLTGHSGFKGSWLSMWLKVLGAKVFGMSLHPTTEPNLFTMANVEHICHKSYYADVRNLASVQQIVEESSPEIVFHLAAQPLVRESYRTPQETFATNVMGTVNLLEALRDSPTVQTVICITTDKVYENREWPWPYRENDHLGGRDPYSASKAASELAVKSYRMAFFDQHKIGVATARAGNVIGGGDWSEDRLIPDAMRAWMSNETLFIRNPQAVRPWQHVLESLYGYLMLAEKLNSDVSLAGAYNFGPGARNNACVLEVLEMAQDYFPDGQIAIDNPSPDSMHEATLLALDTYRTNSVLGVFPRWDLKEAIARTCAWYQNSAANPQNSLKLCLNDIAAFTTKESK